MTSPAASEAYREITAGAGLVDFGTRTQLELRGDDRASFLHNLTTNEIRKLPVGSGCEAFLLDKNGKILAFVYVFAGPESLVLETVPEQGPFLIEHLDRYLIREKVELADRSAEWSELYLAGPNAAEVLSKCGVIDPPQARLACSESTINDKPVLVRHVDFTAPGGYLIAFPRDAADTIRQTVNQAGAKTCDSAAFDTARIEAGTPLFGVDITHENLPQEVDRDALAISFVKGCYLGQETVARIDALGHVNRTLVKLRFEGAEVPPPGTPLSDTTREVGKVTSSTFSPKLNAPLALAYVRRGSNTPGTTLKAKEIIAEVIR
ncbi:MAG: folate-binding protein YgfZ [Pirellulales bacterium]|nr:folate-binding protein YgfZ [Pirellulales bacterium]